MKTIFIILLFLFLLACLHQANELTGKSPKRMIFGLIMMLIGGVTLMLFGAFDMLKTLDYIALSLIVTGDLLWMISERRHGKVKVA